MLEIRIKDGKKGLLKLPNKVDEILFRQHCSFQSEWKKYNDWLDPEPPEDVERGTPDHEQWLTKQLPDGIDFELQNLRHIINIMSEYSEQKELLRYVPPGQIRRFLMGMVKVKRFDDIDMETTSASITQLYIHTLNLLNSYQPKVEPGHDLSFTHKGHNYIIPNLYIDAITGQQKFDEISTGEAVEALEVVRAWENNMPNDKDGGIYYTSMLKIIAVLARRIEEDGQPEPFPTSQAFVDRLITDRVIEFQDIPYTVGRDIEAFFLRGTSL